MITLRQLEFALAIAKYKHFKRAAEECNISQSALSLGIAELEKQLDTQIFERNNKQVLITPIGEEILERAKRIFSEVNDLITKAQLHQTPLVYPMTIGIIPTIAPFLLPKVLPKLREDYPNVQLSIVEEQTERLIEKVRHGMIDTAIIALPYPTDGLLTFEFWQEDFLAIFAKQNAENQPKTMDANTLINSNLMLLGEGHCMTDHALSVCHLDTNRIKNSFSNASLTTLIQMALSGMGTTLIPEMAVTQIKQQNPDVATIPLSEPGPHRKLAFITRLNYARVDDVNLLGNVFAKGLSQHSL
ncbi:LysR family transcriptional regulator [Moraxella macacae 0408225]|uniref:LysR family transcriptional regulator n=1 Tax=Moraxella macacae 0408225 TaxID=1230338 RepID=L2F7B0_9GAMM|nr:hydrogen peroxide-inducible genes activator [Moraxella macacae]ELA08790.1 LysR family transcriptional regulator [Moraxella macacae 0408225]